MSKQQQQQQHSQPSAMPNGRAANSANGNNKSSKTNNVNANGNTNGKSPQPNGYKAPQESGVEAQGNAKQSGIDKKTDFSGEHANRHLEEKYPWENIGGFNEGKRFSPTFVSDSQLIKTFVAEKFYSDYYWNTSLVIGVCFFSWLLSKWRFGIFGLIFVLLSASSVYRTEYRRFERNVRDDITRIAVTDRLEKHFESMEWLNRFLAKFWVIYMPALSETVMTIANDTLKDVAPGYGIDALTLDEFTLGTKSPRIDSIKSYTRKGKDIVEWDWAFSFTPNDTSDMTKKEIDKKIDPKVALGVRVGKAMVSKNLPILVEDMSVSGRVKITLKLSLNFPHIKMVSVQLLEPPKIDFALKPVGGDTFGLDIMSLVPGLSTLITTIINSNAGPMLYAPNHLDVDVEELMAAQSNDAIGVVAVTTKKVDGLKNTINPYVEVFQQNDTAKHIRTSVKAHTKSAVWNETKYFLVNNLQQKLNFEIYDFQVEKKKGELYATHDFEMEDLLQNDSQLNIEKSLEMAGRKKGSIKYDIRWFPVIQSEKSSTDDDSKESDVPDSEVGILKLTIHQAKKLDSTASLTGLLNPKAELFVNGDSIKKYRTLKNSNEPSWEESTEFLVTQKADTQVKFIIQDTGARLNATIASLEESLDNLVFNCADGRDTFKLSPEGEVRISAVWKPLSLSGVSAAANYVPPIGAIRLHVREAKDLLNLEKVGKVDPYCKILLNNRLKYQTAFYPDTCDPVFNEVVYIPVVSQSQHISIEMMDEQNVGKDRPLGVANITAGDIIKKGPNNTYLFHDGSETVNQSQLQIKDKKPKGKVFYSLSFIPSIPVYSLTELEELQQKEEQWSVKQKEHSKQEQEWEELYKKKPNDYEWMEIEDPDYPNITKKEKMSLDQLITYRSGTLGIHILEGSVKKADTFVQILFDDIGSPSYVSSKTNGRKVNPEVGDGYIRDLPNSKIIFRNTKKQQVSEVDQILDEQSFKTIDLLRKAYYEPHTVTFGSSKVKLSLEYIPSSIKLPPSETVSDTGMAQVEFLDAEGLASADSNGKADPYITVSLHGVELFKSKVVKKTLNPTWNQTTTIPMATRARSTMELNVFDWDRAGKNELIGSTIFDISQVKPLSVETVTLPLQPQGSIRMRVTFSPEYIRPKVGVKEFGVNLSALAGAPLKGVGVAADIGMGAVGAGAGLVTGGVGVVGKGGSSLFKTVLGGKKSKKSLDQPRNSLDNSDVKSTRSSKSKKSNKKDEEGGAIAAAQEENGSSDEASTYSQVASGKKATRGELIVISGTNLGKQAQLKISLAIDGKLKEIYRTKNSKASSNTIRWDEEAKFEAPQDAEVVFGGIIHHVLGKDQELGTAQVKLTEAVDNPREMKLDLGQGEIIVKFKYSPEPEEDGGTPPPPGW